MVTVTRDPVRWVLVLFAATFALQRLSLPGISIPITVPFAVVWMGLALYYQVVAVNVRRLILWLLAGAVGALMVIPQLLFVNAPYVSVNSWVLWMVVWLPLVVHLRDRSRAQYDRCLRAITQFGLGLSALSILFVLVQLLGFGYRDFLGEYVPAQFLVQGYNSSYPIAYESPFYKSNAWLALEPSFLSFMLGVCIVSAILVKAHPVKLLVLVAGLLATTAGSGFAVVGVAVVAMVASRRWSLLKPYALPVVVLVGAAAVTPFGQSIIARTGEAGDDRSSTALRAIEPYKYLWPEWVNDPAAIFLGRGAGSSRWVVDNLGILGLTTPNVPKLIFDYGLFAGSLLLVLMLATYLRTPEPILALALGFSMFTVQAASQPLVMCSVAVAALWAPRALGRDRPPATGASRPQPSRIAAGRPGTITRADRLPAAVRADA
jgi:hypothetical protein